MTKSGDILLLMRRLAKLYRDYLDQIRLQHNLTMIEIKIISFLYNNPQSDTARDISHSQLLSKGNVSSGVDSLIKKSMLLGIQDKHDLRIIHLSLTKQAEPIVKKIEDVLLKFRKQIFIGFSEDETNIFSGFINRILQNI